MNENGQSYVDNPDSFTPARLATADEKKQLEFMDTLTNLITSLGTSYDKRTAGRYEQTRNLRYDHTQLTALYRESWIAGKMVDAVPEDMTRAWRTLSSDEIPPDEKKKFERLEQELNVRYYFNFAHKMARLYGGAVIVLAIENTGEPETPLDLNIVKKGSFRHMKVVDLTRLIPSPNVIVNPMDPMYGQPEYYTFAESGIKVHNSRCIRFDGVRLPFMEYRRNAYWHDSILNRLYDPIQNMDLVTLSSASLVYESNIDVVKINGMMDYLQSPEGTKLLQKRMILQKQLKATTNQTIIDNQDEFMNVTKQFTGLPSLIDRYLIMLTAGSDTPAGRILGDSASAFNVSGSGSDLNNYYDSIRSQQVIEYNPKLSFLDKLLAIHLGWNNKYELEFEWNSLFQKSPEEEAKAEKARCEVYSLMVNNEVMTPGMVAEELQNNPYFSSITQERVAKRLKQDEIDIDNKNRQDELALEATEKQITVMGQSPEGGTTTKKGTGEHGKPDTGKQLRDMKPQGSKDIKAKNKEGRSRVDTEKEQV